MEVGKSLWAPGLRTDRLKESLQLLVALRIHHDERVTQSDDLVGQRLVEPSLAAASGAEEVPVALGVPPRHEQLALGLLQPMNPRLTLDLLKVEGTLDQLQEPSWRQQVLRIKAVELKRPLSVDASPPKAAAKPQAAGALRQHHIQL